MATKRKKPKQRPTTPKKIARRPRTPPKEKPAKRSSRKAPSAKKATASPTAWRELVALAPPDAFRQAMAVFGDEGPSALLIQQLSERVSRVAIDPDDEHGAVFAVTFQRDEQSPTLRLYPSPKRVPEGALPSYRKVLAVFNGAHFDGLRYSDVGVSLNPVGASGAFESGMFSLDDGWGDFFDEHAPELAPFADQLSIPIDLGSSDHYILHPTKTDARGEPAVVYLGHDETELKSRGPDLDVAGHFLQILADCLLPDRPHHFIG